MKDAPANILVVDDAADNLLILDDLLTFHGHSVKIVRSGEAALAQVQTSPPDLILLDIMMPGIDGYEVCARLQAEESTRHIPIIFVSALEDVSSKVRGFQVGDVDYINKPFQAAEIIARVSTHITLLRLRKRLEEKNAELEHLANTDSLTDLFNRRRFFRTAETEFQDAMRAGRPFSITMMDLDHFKRVNDTHGHLIGDQVLAHVARLIRSSARETDIAARYGGEEFVILHPEMDRREGFQVAEQIRRSVETTPYQHQDNSIPITLSAGVVDTVVGSDCQCLDGVLALADEALYRAKESGRNKVVVLEE